MKLKIKLSLIVIAIVVAIVTSIAVILLRRASGITLSLYTTSNDPKDRAKAKELGAVDYIQKPIKKSELLEKAAKLTK